MAILDQDRNAVVLRIVYDGPASAGKTTSVRALGDSLGRPITTPEEAGERTLFFDWLDYTGGLFEGHQIRCQVVSVPGQQLLGRRRAALLRTADAVVYVSALTDANLPATVQALKFLKSSTGWDGVPVGVVLQANKRDLPDAAAMPAIRASLDEAGLLARVVESTATTGAGIREAFVFGVRLALERVREQIRTGSLRIGTPEIDGPDALYRSLRNDELDDARGSAGVSAGSRGEAFSLASVIASASSDGNPIVEGVAPPGRDEPAPAPPDESVQAGMIWPPIEGRVLLGEATMSRHPVARVDTGWAAETEYGWRLHSPSESLFADPEQGRADLIRWARLHAQHGAFLSAPRCIALASDGAGRYRLWQVVRSRPSLREQLAARLDEHDCDVVAEALTDAGARLLEAWTRIRRAAVHLPVTLDTVGMLGTDTRYVGLMPQTGVELPATAEETLDALADVVADWAKLGTPMMRALGRARFHASDDVRRAILGKLLSLFDDREMAS